MLHLDGGQGGAAKAPEAAADPYPRAADAHTSTHPYAGAAYPYTSTNAHAAALAVNW